MIVQSTDLKNYITRLFAAAGLSEENAGIVSEILIDAELNGVSSHGIAMVPSHIRKLKTSYNPDDKLEYINDGASFAVVNANNMIGMLSAYRSMEIAIEKARNTGISIVLCNNANTFSAAAYYAEMAVNAGMIGVVMCNSPAQMAPLGGKERLLGTNPIAIGIPANKEPPFVFDMATSVVAKSKINEAVSRGDETIPFGWATDSDGLPTNDPLAAQKGLILPLAGAKGYGLCMAIDMIAGLLGGASYLDRVGRFYPVENGCMNVGHAFVALNPMLLYGEGFFDEADEYLRRVRTSKSASCDPVLVPGDINLGKRNEMLRDGITVDDKIIKEMSELSAELGVPFDLT